MAIRPRTAVDPQRIRQLLVDVSIIASHDAGTGIQRVVRSLLLELLEAPPPGFEIRPVRATRKKQYCYANSYLASPNSSASASEDERVRVFNGDIFLGLDLASRIVPRRQLDLLKWRTKGVRCVFVVYDLLPLLHRDWFTPRSRRSFRHWLSTLAIHADALLCISSSVANEVRICMKLRFDLATNEPVTGWFHLGSDLPVALVSSSTAIFPDKTYPRPNPEQRSVLMVGTIEPRKGHAQVLDAFDLLWRNGNTSRLIIVGRQGWHVESFINRLERHPEAGKRLFWLPDIDDPQLVQLYADLDGLVMASEAEGFGLPLVEAAQYAMPVFVRDLAVFREIAGTHATYFRAQSGSELAPQLEEWLDKLGDGSAPTSQSINSLSWSVSAKQLKAFLAELDCLR